MVREPQTDTLFSTWKAFFGPTENGHIAQKN